MTVDNARAKKVSVHPYKKPRIRFYTSPAGYCSLTRYFNGRQEFWFGLAEIAWKRAMP